MSGMGTEKLQTVLMSQVSININVWPFLNVSVTFETLPYCVIQQMLSYLCDFHFERTRERNPRFLFGFCCIARYICWYNKCNLISYILSTWQIVHKNLIIAALQQLDGCAKIVYAAKEKPDEHAKRCC